MGNPFDPNLFGQPDEGGQKEATGPDAGGQGLKLPEIEDLSGQVPDISRITAKDDKVLVWQRRGACLTNILMEAFGAGKQPPKPMGRCCQDVQIEIPRSEAEAGGYTLVAAGEVDPRRRR